MAVPLVNNNGKGWSGGQEHLNDPAFPAHVMAFPHGPGRVAAFCGFVPLLRRKRFDAVDLRTDHERRFIMGDAGREPVERRGPVEAMGRTYLESSRRLLDPPGR